jgi:hypothetical protein
VVDAIQQGDRIETLTIIRNGASVQDYDATTIATASAFM